MKPLAFVLAVLLQVPQSSVEGVAIRAGGTEPIPNARVVLTRIDGRLIDTQVANADARGRFAFRAVAAGAYRLLAYHDAFMRSEGRSVTLTDGQSIRDVVLIMTPTGVITGRVVDEYGNPVADVYVRAALKPVGADLKVGPYETITNDLGDYRLFGLPPGSYIVSAAPYTAPRLERRALPGGTVPQEMIIIPTPPGPNAPGEGQGMTPLPNVLKNGDLIPFMALRGESHATVYYPGTTDRANAASVEVPAGAVIGAINFTTAVQRSGP